MSSGARATPNLPTSVRRDPLAVNDFEESARGGRTRALEQRSDVNLVDPPTGVTRPVRRRRHGAPTAHQATTQGRGPQALEQLAHVVVCVVGFS